MKENRNMASQKELAKENEWWREEGERPSEKERETSNLDKATENEIHSTDNAL